MTWLSFKPISTAVIAILVSGGVFVQAANAQGGQSLGSPNPKASPAASGKLKGGENKSKAIPHWKLDPVIVDSGGGGSGGSEKKPKPKPKEDCMSCAD
jgi:hypothetical protein